METEDTFGSWVRRRRRALDLTQEELARRLGYSVASLRKIESGERRASKQIAVRLAECLAIPPEERAIFLAAARGDPGEPFMPGNPRGLDTSSGPASRITPSHLAAAPGRSIPPAQPNEVRPAHDPAATLARIGIPADVSSFIGREREFASLIRLLRRPGVRLVTLAGTPGIGKTRLALRVAQAIGDDFAGGAAYANLLNARNADDVTAAVALAVGAREEPGRLLIETLEDSLRAKHLLLVLDNFEQAIEAAPVVTELLSGTATVKALVTSRVLLDLRGEHVFNVPPLTLPDLASLRADGEELVALLESYESVQLFVERSQARLAEFELTPGNARAVAEICRLLDGLPLAIELVAARSAVLPPEAMLAALASNRLDPVAGRLRDAPARQQTLRAAITWSYNLLPDAEQRLWRRLSAFRDGFTLEAAQAVCAEDRAAGAIEYDAATAPDGGPDGDGVAEGLESLIKASLAWQETTAGGPRYYQLPTIREYGRDRLHASGEAEDIRRRHAEYFTAEARAVAGQVGEAAMLDYLQVEHGNLIEALEWHHRREGGIGLEVRLADILWRYWYARGHFAEGRAHLERILAGRDLPDEARALLAGEAGMLAFSQGDVAPARRHFDVELTLCRKVGAPAESARPLQHLGRLLLEEGDLAGAQACFEEGLALRRAYGPKNSAGVFLSDLGELARLAGDYERARALYLESLTIHRELGSERFLAWTLLSLGCVAYRCAAYGEARRYFVEGLRASEAVGIPLGIGGGLAGLAGVAASQGQLETAARLLGAAEALRLSIGAQHWSADRAEIERWTAVARASLPPATFHALWAEGQVMSLAEAIELAHEVAMDREG